MEAVEEWKAVRRRSISQRLHGEETPAALAHYTAQWNQTWLAECSAAQRDKAWRDLAALAGAASTLTLQQAIDSVVMEQMYQGLLLWKYEARLRGRPRMTLPELKRIWERETEAIFGPLRRKFAGKMPPKTEWVERGSLTI